MNGLPCPHCGQTHPAGTAFCPLTGRRVPPAGPPAGQVSPPPPQYPPYDQPPAYGQALSHEPVGAGSPFAPPPGYGQDYGSGPPSGYSPQLAPQFAPTVPAPATGSKSIGTILTQAFALYQKNFGALLLACAILMAPAALLRAAAVTLILAPTVATEWSASRARDLSQQTADEFRQQLLEAQQDPKKYQANQREHQKEMQDLANAWTTTGRPAVGGLVATLLGLLAVVAGLALVYGLAVPLTTGALTILVADRATGGTASVGQAYGLLFGRLGKLMSAVIPGFIFVLLGFCFFVIPGLVLGFLFAFVTPVVLLENVGGMQALKRSVNLVQNRALQVFLVFLVFAAIRIFTQIVAHLIIPGRALLVGSLVEDALMILFMPVPIIGTVLLYLDIRRQAGAPDDRLLRAGIDGLRRA